VVIDTLREMRRAGRTVVMVHHDLDMARGLFDWAVLLAGNVVSAGPIGDVMSEANLRAAYGGRLVMVGASPAAEAAHVRG
jgi:manganese/zinc/iron transport system ATP- binding protein